MDMRANIKYCRMILEEKVKRKADGITIKNGYCLDRRYGNFQIEVLGI